MNDNRPLLEVQNLKKYFKTKRGMLHAVDDVTFTIGKGKTLGVVGESGCGKSTTGRAILRLIEPTGGCVLFDGEDISRLSNAKMRAKRREMQIIFQDPFSSLDPRMSVSQIIEEPMRLHGMYKSSHERETQTLKLMDTVGLARRLYNTYPHELDGGRRQRIGIARALSLNPKFIVCDEPVSALDVSIQAQILNLMKDLQAELGLTYMFSMHLRRKHICSASADAPHPSDSRASGRAIRSGSRGNPRSVPPRDRFRGAYKISSSPRFASCRRPIYKSACRPPCVRR